MQNAPGMDVSQAVYYLSEHLLGLLLTKFAPLLDILQEVPAIGVFHHDVHMVFALEDFHQSNDVGVLDGLQDVHLAQNLLSRVLVLHAGLVDRLYGHLLSGQLVDAQCDPAERALADFLHQFVVLRRCLRNFLVLLYVADVGTNQSFALLRYGVRHRHRYGRGRILRGHQHCAHLHHSRIFAVLSRRSWSCARARRCREGQTVPSLAEGARMCARGASVCVAAALVRAVHIATLGIHLEQLLLYGPFGRPVDSCPFLARIGTNTVLGRGRLLNPVGRGLPRRVEHYVLQVVQLIKILLLRIRPLPSLACRRTEWSGLSRLLFLFQLYGIFMRYCSRRKGRLSDLGYASWSPRTSAVLVRSASLLEQFVGGVGLAARSLPRLLVAGGTASREVRAGVPLYDRTRLVRRILCRSSARWLVFAVGDGHLGNELSDRIGADVDDKLLHRVRVSRGDTGGLLMRADLCWTVSRGSENILEACSSRRVRRRDELCIVDGDTIANLC